MKKYLELLNFWSAKTLFSLLVFAFCILDFTLSSVAAPGIISTVVGTGERGYSGDGGKAAQAKLNFPRAIFVDSLGNLFIADEGNNCIRRVDGQTGIITTIAGGGYGDLGDGKQATEARLCFPSSIFVDSLGNLFIADIRNYRIRRVDGKTGIITTVAGGGTILQSDGDKATQASLNRPSCIFVDSLGNLFIADEGAHRIRRVDGKAGIISTVAGTGEPDFSGDGGKATEAGLDSPTSIFVDSSGNLFIADTKNHRIRRVDGQTGIISTVAGTGEAGFFGDGGKATQASLNSPNSVFVDSSGNLFIADTKNHRIRRVDGKTGIITTVAGTGAIGHSGDGEQATEAKLNFPYGVFVDFSGNLFIVGYNNHCIRRVESIAAPTILGGIFAPRTDTTPPAKEWDINKDGVVDISDLVLTGKHFGESGVGIIGDCNGDGRVDITDLTLIGNHFGENDTLIW